LPEFSAALEFLRLTMLQRNRRFKSAQLRALTVHLRKHIL
jgi:hypothetical protein